MTSGPGNVVINHANTVLVSAADGSIHASDGNRIGLFADDTRFISEYALRLNGEPLHLIGASRLSFRQARWLYGTAPIRSVHGDVRDATVTVQLDRLMSERRLHEDIVIRAYGRDDVSLLLALSIETDFADIFEVISERWQRRTDVTTTWHAPNRLETLYERGDFVRRCEVRLTGDAKGPAYANGMLRIPVDLLPGNEWHLCVQYDFATARRSRPALAPCPMRAGVGDRAEQLRRRWHRTVSRLRKADPRLLASFQQSVEDFAALRLYELDFSPDVWLPAAGIPWFVAPFGRDSIIASIQTLPVHPLFAMGTLQTL
ncbi:MAG TPA: glycogen debranching N-terminal domain-containing protein, partial [Dehalococcoidia bacterium]|nr:glycogen debranching N-terminal domain-containing protein [Dehalococcoidia bacterium]